MLQLSCFIINKKKCFQTGEIDAWINFKLLFSSSSQRNQFLEAESIELEKERTQIRFEMRNLLVNNEDLLRMNTQLQAELKRMRDRIVELESDNNVMVERFKKIDVRNKSFSQYKIHIKFNPVHHRLLCVHLLFFNWNFIQRIKIYAPNTQTMMFHMFL